MLAMTFKYQLGMTLSIVDVEASAVVFRIEPEGSLELHHHLEEGIVFEESFPRRDALAVDDDVDVADELRWNRRDHGVVSSNPLPQGVARTRVLVQSNCREKVCESM